MKIKLTRTMITDRLSFDKVPVFDKNGTIKYVENTAQKAYIVFDTGTDSPVGFGVKVGKTDKTFIVQRRLEAKKGEKGKVKKFSLGSVNDFNDLPQAYEEARRKLLIMKVHKKNPNDVEKEQGNVKTAASTTVAEAFALYRKNLVSRPKSAKDSTLKNYDLALRRLEREGVQIAHRELGSLSDQNVLDAFDALAASPRPLHVRTLDPVKIARAKSAAKKAGKKVKAGSNIPPQGIRTATEQTFRWATRVAAFVIANDARAAGQQNRASMQHNPFDALKLQRRFRKREQLEAQYDLSASRNPMSLHDGSLGRFLDAVWERRQVANYETAADYLLLTLLWGMRRGEGAALHWRDRITASEAKVCSWVDLKAKIVHLHDTKNRADHDLPLAPAACEILRRRHSEAKITPPDHLKKWVFPARSSRAKSGHYMDSKAILDGLRKTAKIEVLRTHDLRRTFGRVADEITSYSVVKRLLNHKSLADPTTLYTKVDDERLRDAMARIEHAILSTSPRMTRALLPLPATV